MDDQTVQSFGLMSADDFADLVAISQVTPGPIAINCATYVGYKQKGFIGALIATIGMILPSFCIIFAISRFLNRFLEITWIAHAFQGIKIAVGILILDAAIKMLQKMQKKTAPRVFMLCAFAAMLLINIFSIRISSIILMLTAGLISLIIFMVKKPVMKGGAGK